jgi:hypothetical protein
MISVSCVIQLTEAKELYKTTSGSPFNLDHCWGILKDTPKWQATQRENEARAKKSQRSSPPPPSTNMSSSTNNVSSPTAIDVKGEESEPSRSVLGQVCLEGSKAAKRKRAEDASIHSIVSMQKDLVTISRERLASMNAAKDDAIMSKDLSSMDNEARAYYQRKRRAIIARELEQEERERKEKEKKDREEKEKKEKKEKEEREKKEKERKEKEEAEEEEDDNEENDGQNDYDGENNGDSENDNNGDAEEETEE